MAKSISEKRRLACDYQRVHNKTPEGVRTRVVAIWKYRGVIGNLHKYYDDVYLPETNCHVCEKEFKSRRDKCMDHSHTTGKIRQVLCVNCNVHDNWRKVLIPELF